jgi:hypothetical protein
MASLPNLCDDVKAFLDAIDVDKWRSIQSDTNPSLIYLLHHNNPPFKYRLNIQIVSRFDLKVINLD